MENSWICENVAEQARAMFTTWCFMEHVEADTAKCDSVLLELYNNSNAMLFDMDYDEFENYMIALIV